MEAKTDCKCPMAISDMTDLHNWKPNEMIMNSGLRTVYRKRKKA